MVQWSVVILGAVVLAGWIGDVESNRRKVIIHIPHMHHSSHKPSVRHVQKGHGSSPGKGHAKGGGHVHKHHHHYYEDDHPEHAEPSHSSHSYDDYHHHPHSPLRSHHASHHSHPPHHHHPPSHPAHHHTSASGHHHHFHPPHHHHSDHHAFSSHHMDHHRHPDHHDDHHDHHLRAEESMYSYDHHHRPHYYMDHPRTRSYDCMEVCEKCKMRSLHHRREHDEAHSGIRSPHAAHEQAKVPNMTPPERVPAAHGGYLVRENSDFKPSLAAGELRESPSSGYPVTGKGPQTSPNYAGYFFKKPNDQSVRSNPTKANHGLKHVQYHEQDSEFDSSFPEFQNSDYMPTGNWYNHSLYITDHGDPNANVVGYHRQSGQIQHVRYAEEGAQTVDSPIRDERLRDAGYLNRHRYETVNR